MPDSVSASAWDVIGKVLFLFASGWQVFGSGLSADDIANGSRSNHTAIYSGAQESHSGKQCMFGRPHLPSVQCAIGALKCPRGMTSTLRIISRKGCAVHWHPWTLFVPQSTYRSWGVDSFGHAKLWANWDRFPGVAKLSIMSKATLQPFSPRLFYLSLRNRG